MMETNCELIKDLLPLYLDDLCSNYTKNVVEEHIAKCADCKCLLDTLSEQNKSPISIQAEIKKINPLKKIKRRNRIITITGIVCTLAIVSAAYFKLFLIGFTASTTSVAVQSIGMLDDAFTFEIELYSNSKVNTVRRVYISPIMHSESENGSGHVYIRVNTVMALPFPGKGVYKTSIGFDEGALGHDGITAIYLIGKDQNDMELIWEAK